MAVKLKLFTFCSFCVLKQIIEIFFQNFEQQSISKPNFAPSDVGPADDKDCLAWTSTWLPKQIPRKFMDCTFLCGFCAASVFEECKTSPSSNNADITSLFCADLNERYGRRDNIRIFGVEENYDEDVKERVVDAAYL